jgi:PAC2 family
VGPAYPPRFATPAQLRGPLYPSSVSLYQLDATDELLEPVMIAAFDGWVDGGRAGTLAAEALAEPGRTIATFNPDMLYDYRARRPVLDIIDGKLVELDWPELNLTATRVGDKDLLVLTGPEPDYRWREFSAGVIGLARQLRVSSWVSMGAIPATVAHTRPVPILGTSSAPGLLPAGVTQGPAGNLRVPSAALSVLELSAAEVGIPAIGFYAQVPHYASGAFPTGALELLKRVGQYLDLELPVGELPRQALETRSLLDAAVAGDERTSAYVKRLEQMSDEARLPSGDELIADIERFLRDRGNDEGGNQGGGLPN